MSSPDNTPKLRMVPPESVDALARRDTPRTWRSAIGRSVLIFFAAGLFSGCAMVEYKPNASAGPARPAKPADYPMPVYTEEMTIPRPCAIIGTVSINPGKFTVFGGSAAGELVKVMQAARQKGADAVKLTAAEEPDFANPNYRLKAELLRYTDVWETVPVSWPAFRAYFKTNAGNLDPIEGVWSCAGLDPHSIGIMKNRSKPGREFIGFILNSRDPVWPDGMKKVDIRRGLEPGSYILLYYCEDFERREIPIILRRGRSFTLTINTREEERDVTYTRQ